MADIEGCTHENGLATGASIKRSVKIATSTTTGVKVTSAQNKEGAAVIATWAYVHIKTPASAACTLNIGTASTDVTSDNLIDGVSVAACPANTVYNNVTDGGSNGKTRQYVASGQYFTAYVASGDANGLEADFYFDYQLLTGGNPF